MFSTLDVRGLEIGGICIKWMLQPRYEQSNSSKNCHGERFCYKETETE